jgi:hypothetical protein
VTTVSAPSAYPFDLTDLLPHARTLAATLGDIPSRNRLMKELKIGAPKATALREALTDETSKPPVPTLPVAVDAPTGAPDPDPLTQAAYDHLTGLPDRPTLTLVPDPEPDDDTTDTTPDIDATSAAEPAEAPSLATGDGHPDTTITTPAVEADTPTGRRPRSWPVWLLALPAFVAIWSGWVGLGELTGFGVVHPLPGILDTVSLNTAITLPIGVETYAAYALAVWLTGRAPAAARRFARNSAIGSLMFGALGQVAYHLMTAAHVVHAPWWITTAVSCLPVAVLGMGAALAHLVRASAVE